MNANVLRYLRDLNASADDLALANKKYTGRVLGAFPTATFLRQFIWNVTVTAGKSFQFPATWKMTSEPHTPGTELPGNEEPISEDRVVTANTKEDVAHNWTTPVDKFIGDFDTRRNTAVQAVRSIGRTLESRLIRCVILGAQQSARGDNDEFPAGNRLTSPRSTDAATAYPVSLAGSLALQADFGEIAQKMDEKDVPREGRVAIITPYLERVLRYDNSLLSVDYQSGANDKLTRKITVVEGFHCFPSNLYPTADLSGAAAEPYAAYRVNCEKSVCCFIGDKSAVGNVEFGGIEAIPMDWHSDKRAWLVGAAYLHGARWLRPEACGEIHVV